MWVGRSGNRQLHGDKMIDKENFKYYANALSLKNTQYDANLVESILRDINDKTYTNLVHSLLTSLNKDIENIDEIQDILYPLFFSIKENNYYNITNIVLSNLNKDIETVDEIKDILCPLFFNIKENDYYNITNILLSNLNKDIKNIDEIKNILCPLFYSIREQNEYNFYKILFENTCNDDYSFLINILESIKSYPSSKRDILDSFSDNQLKSKSRVLDLVEKHNFVNSDSEVIIIGSWYGSILIPGLAHKVKKISCIDLDEQVLKIAKNRLFAEYKNVEYLKGDVFDLDLKRYHSTDLFINTSCEHMPPMNTWPYWPKHTNFVFTSNNMTDIEGHVNCVESMEVFKTQLPERSAVLSEDTIADERGSRFILAGKISS